MKKVMIYMPVEKLKPIGGPAGYLYNLYTQFRRDGITNIKFLEISNNNERYRCIYNKLPKLIKDIYRINFRNKEYKKLISTGENIKIDFNKYDYIHFHSTKDLYSERNLLKDFKGKIILTSHTPKPPHLEIIEDSYTNLERILYKKKRIDNLKYIDEYAFDKADYIVFPCEDSEEPYFNNWEEYKYIKNKNKNKYKYLLSGTEQRYAKIEKEEILKKYDIPQNAFIISYVGRHNEVKGYDKLKEIGEKILKNNNDVYFLIAGTESPLSGLKHDRWIEVGWTNDPHSLIAASDMFILPNKETYFDLIMLEVLSLGKIVLASNTGGNKYFRKNNPGVLIYNNINEALDLIKYVKNLSSCEKIELQNKNKEVFNNEFSNKVFSENYIKLINSLD